MSKLEHHTTPRSVSLAHWLCLLPVVALLPLAAGSGCTNSGIVGDDCPAAPDCLASGSAGKSGSGNDSSAGKSGSGNDGSAGKSSGGNDGSAGKSGGCAGSSSGCMAGSAGSATGGGSSGSGATCGGLLGTQCAADEFCKFPLTAGCGAGDQTGTCTPKPELCGEIYAPVCGCDGKTYGNDCEATSQGVSVASNGECAGGDSTTCGGRGGRACAANQYCSYSLAADCGRADATGTCADIPMGVACLTNYDPVCGCDGHTYGNACSASVAGMSIDHTGACKTGEICGGFIGAGCQKGFFCDYPLEMACGNADGTGTCQAIPELCPANVAPVCACDGQTYSNACMANANGVSVGDSSACK